MSTVLIDPGELRTRGFEILVHELGWVNAVRFIQQYEPSRLNYTAEREHLLPDWDAAELVRQMSKLTAAPGSNPAREDSSPK
ncbi:MAG TPA: hypothetical protein VIL86_16745 [Tepidisphaeraceae bacterium]|jgi:hypothetical protein